MKDMIGVIHGRFQILHKGHMEYLLAGKERCDHLLIGIANPDKKLTGFSTSNPHRSEDISNPCTYFERLNMIKNAMLEEGVPRSEFDIIPFPINYPELIFSYAPSTAKYYMTIYDEWGYEKLRILEYLGCEVEVMWNRKPNDRLTSGTEVRHLIAEDKPWNHLVPKSVYEYVTSNKIDLRIQSMAFKDTTVE